MSTSALARDWAGMIRELQAAGLSLAAIAARIGVATSTCGDLAVGRHKSPRGDAAMALYELHRAMVKKGQHARPASAPPGGSSKRQRVAAL